MTYKDPKKTRKQLKELKIKRESGGKWAPGQSGNPKGRAKEKKLTSREARARLPDVILRIVNLASKNPKWLEKLQEESPTQFATLLITLARYAEKDEPPPPPEESMSNEDAVAILDEVKANAYMDGHGDGIAGRPVNEEIQAFLDKRKG